MNIKCFFGFHEPVITEREFIGYEFKHDEHMGMQKYYKFKSKAECFRCGKKLKALHKVLWPFTYEQPYDINFPKE
jgi:hypothetical protein